MTRRYGIAPLSHLELSPLQMVANAAAAGFDALGLRLVPATPSEAQHDTRGLTPLVRETAARLRDSGLQLLDIEVLRLQPQTVVRDYLPVLEAGAFLGARHLLVAPQDADPSRLAERVAALAELASGFGLLVDLEPTPWYEVSTLSACEAAIQASGRQDVGLIVDPIHLDRAGQGAAHIAALPASRFRYWQLCDAPAERPTERDELLRQARSDRLLPGQGALPLADYAQALPADLPVSLEVPLAGAWGAASPLARARAMLAAARALLDPLDRARRPTSSDPASSG